MTRLPFGRAETRDEKGDTYIELLIAVVIIAFSVVAILGALTTSITSSAEHRSLSVEDTLLKSYMETAKYQIQLQPTPDFMPCATVSTYTTGAKSIVFTNSYAPTYTVAITQVKYWNGTAFVSTCSNTLGQPNQNNGIQLITVTAGNTQSNVSGDLSTVVRDPNWRSCYESGSTTSC